MKNWRYTKEYRKWRIAVIRRDKTCVICNSRKRRQAHHLNHASYFKDLRFNIDNGVTLCQQCHSQFHNNYKKNTRQKCTAYDFKNFKDIAMHYMKLHESVRREI